MSDKMTPEQRHRCMSRVRSKNTKPELLVRKYLFANGFRYRVCVKELPGKPDIVAAQVPDGRLRKRVFLAWARVRLLLIPEIERRFLGEKDRTQPRARPERGGGFAAYGVARHPDMGMPAQAEGAGGYARIAGVYAEPHFPDGPRSGYAREGV